MEQKEGTTSQNLQDFLDHVFGAVAPGHWFDEMPDAEWLIVEDLIGAPPGAAKSKLATDLSNRLWEEKEKATLYLMLTHSAIEERLKHIVADGKGDFWNHYRGHDGDCQRSKWASQGYIGGDCTCGKTKGHLTADKPTLAALNVVFTFETSDLPIHEDALWFPLWIIDEIDFGRFVGEQFATEWDIQQVVYHYPPQTAHGGAISLEPMKRLASALLAVRETLIASGETQLNGQEFYQEIQQKLQGQGLDLPELAGQLDQLHGKLPMGWWVGQAITFDSQPRNFMPYLLPIFCEEAAAYLNGTHFNPRIHLVNQKDRPPLRIRWRRKVAEPWDSPAIQEIEAEHGYVPQPAMIILDASADLDLLNYVFPNIWERFKPSLPHWPDNVHVHQWADSTVSRGQLGFYDDDTDDTISHNPKLEQWYERIRQALDGFDRSWSIGIITHQRIEEELAERVKSWGFQVQEPMHFFNLRGSNDFEDCQVLVVLGCPIPNLGGFQEECQALLYDAPEALSFKPNNKTLSLDVTEGRQYPVKVFGYWEPLVSKYYWQKCHAELYQAIHRLRPYIPKDYDRHLFLFTNVPIQGVAVDEIMVDSNGWKWQAAQHVKKRLADGHDAPATEVADAFGKTGKTIANNGHEIATLAGAWYRSGTKGMGGTVNRFTKLPPSPELSES